jgi:hypothetical protein
MADYNGWKNYETWNLKLWLDNDQDTYHYWQHAAREALTVDAQPKGSFSLAASAQLADQIEAEITKDAPHLTGFGFYSDILSASIREVAYREIAESMLEDLQEED